VSASEKENDMDFKENNIEWITGDNTIAVTLTSQRHITKIRKLAEKKPDEVKITTNKDGSIYATLPLSYLKFNPPKDLTEEQRKEIAERFKNKRA
jgi:nucleoside diphosphate kinase